MKYLIINADDFGWSKEIVDSIIDGYKKNIFTSTSVMVTMPAFEYGVQKLKENPGLGTGLHLSMFDGIPVLPLEQVSSLVDPETGQFYTHEQVKKRSSKINHMEIRKEFYAQMDCFLKSGLTPTHIDNHCTFIYQKAKWFQIVLDIAKENNLPVRTPTGDDFKELIPQISRASRIPSIILRIFGAKVRKQMKKSKVKMPNFFVGHFTNGDENLGVEERVQILLHILDNLKDGVTEVLTHPSYKDGLWRQYEMNTWLDKRVIEKLNSLNDVEMTNFKVLHSKGTI